MKLRAAVVAAATLLICPAISQANGRFPFAQHVIVGPGAASTQIVLRATFGMLWSRDSGRTFHWACEQSLGFMGNWDPPMVFGAGSLVVGLPDGLVSSPDGCDFARVDSVPSTSIIDAAASRDAMNIYAVENIPVVPNRVFASTDGGRTWSARASGPPNVSFDTVELAPSDARRVYLSGLDGASRAPVFFRSNDGAMTIEPLPLPAESLAGATGAYVSGVGNNDPDTLYVRIDRDGGTHLARSLDGGRTWSVVFRATGDLRGFAIADDGRIWTGGSMDGLHRSDDRGDHWTRVTAPAPVCLRHHDGALYLCVDWVREPYALGRLRDGSDTIEPVLRFEDARGAFECSASSASQIECAPRWTQQRALVTTRTPVDAGADASRADAAVAMMDANALDAASDGSITPPRTMTCGCSTAIGRNHHSVLAWIAAAGALLRRRSLSPLLPRRRPIR